MTGATRSRHGWATLAYTDEQLQLRTALVIPCVKASLLALVPTSTDSLYTRGALDLTCRFGPVRCGSVNLWPKPSLNRQDFGKPWDFGRPWVVDQLW